MYISRKQTKLKNVLLEKGLSQTDLYNLILKRYGKPIGHDRISNICNGKQRNAKLSTMRKIATVLDIEITQIID